MKTLNLLVKNVRIQALKIYDNLREYIEYRRAKSILRNYESKPNNYSLIDVIDARINIFLYEFNDKKYSERQLEDFPSCKRVLSTTCKA